MGTKGRLGLMMALGYAVQGAWWPILAVHLDDLGISGRGRGGIFATLAVAALVTPPWAGQVADRKVSAQKLLALIYGVGTGLLAVAGSGMVKSFATLFPLFLAYWLIVAPYLGLCNTVAMRNLSRPAEEFGAVRLWGTVGWMAAGWLVSATLAATGPGEASRGIPEAFWIASALSLMMALTSLRLPDTPPLAMGQRIGLAEARALLRRPGVAVAFAAAFGVSMTTPFVYQAVPAYLRSIKLPPGQIAWAMTLGQLPEIVALIALPRVLKRFGGRCTMAAGIASWALYHALFATRPGLVVALLTIPINGLAIAFFHVAAPMFVDAQAPPDHRAGRKVSGS